VEGLPWAQVVPSIAARNNPLVTRQSASRNVVVGATGYFGSLLVEDLLRHTDAEVWVGARRRSGVEKLLRRLDPVLSQRLTPCVGDLTQPASVEAVLPQVGVAPPALIKSSPDAARVLPQLTALAELLRPR
jgi:uncharacterized protein YbjT (DUF2867 family)